MNSRERVHAILNNQKPDRLPFNFWMDRPLMAELDKKFGPNFRVNHYGVDVIETFPNIPFTSEHTGNTTYEVDGKIVVKHPLDSVVQFNDIPSPDVNDPKCYTGIRADRAKYPDKALFALMITPLEILFNKLGMEQFFLDIADHDTLIDSATERISDVLVKAVDPIADCDVDVLYLAGDICSTQGEMMSMDMLRRFCFDPIKEIIDRAHERGLKVFYHTDGHVMNILPLFVDYGVDGINPLQLSANNSYEKFASEYGNKLMLYGGIDNCNIIPNGTPDDVRKHIRHLFSTVGKNGRLIASSHDIPFYVPMENLETMIDEIKKCTY